MKSSDPEVVKVSVADVPALLAEFHPTKNGSLDPRSVSAWSRRRVWWKCPAAQDHEWQKSPRKRGYGRGCPFCRGYWPSTTNNLAREHPEIAAEWNHERNEKLTPADVTFGSGRRVWWRCRVNSRHEWRAVVDSRSRGSGCPHCARERPRHGRAGSKHLRSEEITRLINDFVASIMAVAQVATEQRIRAAIKAVRTAQSRKRGPAEKITARHG